MTNTQEIEKAADSLNSIFDLTGAEMLLVIRKFAGLGAQKRFADYIGRSAAYVCTIVQTVQPDRMLQIKAAEFVGGVEQFVSLKKLIRCGETSTVKQ